MDNNILKQWANLLLDTGKRNNLINFRDTKFSTVELVYPNYSTLFDRINNNNSFEVFDPKSDDIDEYYFDNDIDEVETDDVKIHSKEEYVNHYKNKLRNNSQILIYNSFKKPFASLKNIMKKGKLVIEETGVNVIYIAFGFIHWKESEDSDIIFKSPILLKPVKIINKSLNDPFIISELENEVVVNPTFSFKLKNEYGINLPEYIDEPLEEYYEKVKISINRMKWELTKEVKISSFSFMKINMYNDITNNIDKICENKNIRILLGESPLDNSILDNVDNNLDNNEILNLHSVVDADSSQIEAIKMAKKGKKLCFTRSSWNRKKSNNN